jgi:hypothetical protein
LVDQDADGKYEIESLIAEWQITCGRAPEIGARQFGTSDRQRALVDIDPGDLLPTDQLREPTQVGADVASNLKHGCHVQ